MKRVIDSLTEQSVPHEKSEELTTIAMGMDYPEHAKMGLQDLYVAWIRNGGWKIEPAPSPDWMLPESVMIETTEEAALPKPQRDARMNFRIGARKTRVERCVWALENGWEEGEAVAFICSKEEWRTAKRIIQERESNMLKVWDAISQEMK